MVPFKSSKIKKKLCNLNAFRGVSCSLFNERYFEEFYKKGSNVTQFESLEAHLTDLLWEIYRGWNIKPEYYPENIEMNKTLDWNQF